MANSTLVKFIPQGTIENPNTTLVHIGNLSWTRGCTVPLDQLPSAGATINVNNTFTGPPGSNASVTNVGSPSNASLDFTIPAGANGNDGLPGDAATINVNNTFTGPPGSPASVVNIGNTTVALLDFTIPSGNDGLPGSVGPQGQTPGFGYVVTSGGVGGNGQFLLPSSGSDFWNTDSGGNVLTAFLLGLLPGSLMIVMQPSDNSYLVYSLGTLTFPGGNVVNYGGSTLIASGGALVVGEGLAIIFVPKGADGTNGTNGIDGAAATINVNNTFTGAPGSSASVVNIGNSSVALLDFTVPAGNDGTNGTNATPAGANGELQFNDGGVFGAMNGSLTDGTNLTLPGGLDLTGGGGAWLTLVGVGLDSLRFQNFGAVPGQQTPGSLPGNTYGNASLTALLGDPDAWITISILGNEYSLPAYRI